MFPGKKKRNKKKSISNRGLSHQIFFKACWEKIGWGEALLPSGRKKKPVGEMKTAGARPPLDHEIQPEKCHPKSDAVNVLHPG